MPSVPKPASQPTMNEKPCPECGADQCPSYDAPASSERPVKKSCSRPVIWADSFLQDIVYACLFLFFVWACIATFSFFWATDNKPLFYLQEPKCVFGFCIDIPRD